MLGSTTSSIIGNAASDAATGLAIASIAGGPIGAAVGGITFAAQTIANLIDSNGPKKIAATDCANNAMYAANTNVNEWRNYPPNMKTQSLQVQYMNQFMQVWGYLEQCCSDQNLGSAGQRCISERQRGGIYDYFAAYYDPIANDPEVSSLATTIVSNNQPILPTTIVNSATGTSLLTYVESNPTSDLFLLGGLAILLLM